MISSVFAVNKKLFRKILIYNEPIKNMNIQDLVPLIIYDDNCYLCSKFANLVNTIARGKLLIVGHYSDIGIEIKSKIFQSNYDSTRMFWFITKNTAYGGRAAILPLFSCILVNKSGKGRKHKVPINYNQNCKTTKAFFMRTWSMFSNSNKIVLKP